MLDPMQKDTAIEVVATIRANMYRYKEAFGNSSQLETDRVEVLAFKDRIRFESQAIDWQEILDFSKQWQERYPQNPHKQDVV